MLIAFINPSGPTREPQGSHFCLATIVVSSPLQLPTLEPNHPRLCQNPRSEFIRLASRQRMNSLLRSLGVIAAGGFTQPHPGWGKSAAANSASALRGFEPDIGGLV